MLASTTRALIDRVSQPVVIADAENQALLMANAPMQRIATGCGLDVHEGASMDAFASAVGVESLIRQLEEPETTATYSWVDSDGAQHWMVASRLDEVPDFPGAAVVSMHSVAAEADATESHRRIRDAVSCTVEMDQLRRAMELATTFAEQVQMRTNRLAEGMIDRAVDL